MDEFSCSRVFNFKTSHLLKDKITATSFFKFFGTGVTFIRLNFKKRREREYYI